MEPSDQKSSLLYVLVAVGAVSLLMAAWVLYQRSGSFSSAKTAKAPVSQSTHAQLIEPKAQCVPSGPHPIDQLQMQVMHAHDMVRQHNFAPAISLYREIAEADPAYPGIQLELSMALLDAKQPEAANDAVNAQLSTSSCLAELTLDQMQTYCRAEMPAVRFSTCQEQVLDMRRSAHLHAALVQMQLGREGSSQPETVAAGTAPTVREDRVAGMPTVTRLPSHVAPVQASHTASRDVVEADPAPRPASKGDRNPLASGDETDAALGAYSR